MRKEGRYVLLAVRSHGDDEGTEFAAWWWSSGGLGRHEEVWRIVLVKRERELAVMNQYS